MELAEHDIDRFVGIPEAAARLNLHPVTARKWVRSSTFPFGAGNPIPVTTIGGKRVVSLRRVLEFINADRKAS